MKRINIIGLCLMAVAAVSVIAVASASALPAFKSAGGLPVTFTAESLLPLEPVLHGNISTAAVNITCQMSFSKGEIFAPEGLEAVRKVLVLYLGCKVEGTSKACTTAGNAEGMISTKEIRAQPGYISHTNPTLAGLLLEPVVQPFTTFTCKETAFGLVKVENAVIGHASPINIESNVGFLLFEENAAKTGSKWPNFENGPLCELNLGSVNNKAWLMDKERELFSKAVELVA